MNDTERAKAAGLKLPEVTFPWTVDTVGKCIVDRYGISVRCHTYGCHHTGDIDLVAFALKHGVDHSSMDKDLRRHFYCLKCREAGRPDRNISFCVHVDKGGRQIIEGAYVNAYAKTKGV